MATLSYELLLKFSFQSYSGKDDHNRVESQLRETKRKLELMSRDLENKDTLNQQLKGKISDLEDRFEETRQEYNTCLISRESIEQQKLDLERELTVFIPLAYKYFLNVLCRGKILEKKRFRPFE